jgi:hypothetical protein
LDDSEEGQTLGDIAAAMTGYTPSEVEKELSELVDKGLAYNTIDELHFKIA